MSGIESCPLCGGPSFEGEPCRPQCDPGALKRKGIELLPTAEGLPTEPSERSERSEAIVTRATR